MLEDSRIRAGEHKLDRILLVHDVVAFQLHVSVRVLSRQLLLKPVNTLLKCLRISEINDQLTVGQEWSRNAAHQIVPCRSASQ